MKHYSANELPRSGAIRGFQDRTITLGIDDRELRTSVKVIVSLHYYVNIGTFYIFFFEKSKTITTIKLKTVDFWNRRKKDISNLAPKNGTSILQKNKCEFYCSLQLQRSVTNWPYGWRVGDPCKGRRQFGLLELFLVD